MDYEKQIKTQKRGLITSIILFIIVAVITGIFIVDTVGGKDYKIVNSLDANNIYELDSNADDNTIIQFDEMMVLDIYASYGNAFNKDTDKDDYVYFTVMIYDAQDSPYYASLEVKVGTEMYDKLMAYSNDTSQELGDMIISACTTVGHVATDINSYYKNDIDRYNEWLGDEGYYIPDSYLKLSYAFESPDQLDTYAKSQSRENIYVGVIFAVALIGILIGMISIINKIKKLKNAPNEFSVTSDSVQTPSYAQPQYTNTQTGEYYDPSQSQYFNPVQNQNKDNE